MLKILSDKYHLKFTQEEPEKDLFVVKGSGRSILLTLLLVVVGGFLLSFLVIMVTPLKRLLPGYPTEQTRKEMVENRIMVDSLKQQINQWQKEMKAIQLVTSGMTPDNQPKMEEENEQGR